MVRATANANFYSLSGESLHQDASPEYQEYRRAWEENPATFTVRPFPLHLDIEITNRCNLRCTFCDKLPLLSRDRFGDMKMPLFRKILDEGEEGRLWGVKLSYRGEPLLHPGLASMVAYAKKRGVLDVYFNTNGMLLTAETSRRLIDAGLDRISVSIEGTDPGAFERNRVGAKFYKIMRNIDALISLRENRGCRHPRVRVQTVRLQEIDLEEYRRFWLPHGDEVAAVDYKQVENRLQNLVHSEWACPQLWQRMTIEWDGTVLPCNNDDFRLLAPGNVKEKDIASCWHDPRVALAREWHRQGLSHLVEACDGCPWRTAQILKLADLSDRWKEK
jgi:radical SAM protein with 4Fe4S-binding SPASM domain